MISSLRPFVLISLVAALCGGCRARDAAEPPDDASLAGRVITPPRGQVRAIPPHNIHGAGVGPYRLGAGLQEVLKLLPHGPRIELFQIEGLLDYRLVPAESDALVIGVTRAGVVRFVSVLDPDIAQTETGVGVGASPNELTVALGAVKPLANGVRDPRLIEFSSLPSTRFVAEDGRVIAAVVGAVDEVRPAKTRAALSCDPAALGDDDVQIVAAARMPASATVERGCFPAEGALVASNGRLAVVLGEEGELRRVASIAVEPFAAAGVVDVDADGDHELAVLSETATDERRTLIVRLYRLQGTRIEEFFARAVYRFELNSSTWVGEPIDRTAFLAEVAADGNALQVGGLFLQRDGGEGLRAALPLETVVLPLRRRLESLNPGDGVGPRDAGPGEPRSRRSKPAPGDGGRGI